MKPALWTLPVIILSCASQQHVTTASLDSVMNAADSLFRSGCYSCLQDALSVYEGLLSSTPERNELKAKALQTALLLGVREKELGIPGDRYLQKASALLGSPIDSTYLKIVDSLRGRTLGIDRDALVTAAWERRVELSESAIRWDRELKTLAERDDLAAYFQISLRCSPPVFIRWEGELPDFALRFPDSRAILYKSAICSRTLSAEALQKILEDEPRFQEVHLFLGDVALARTRRLEAEKHFLEAYRSLPESVPAMMSLAEIYLSFDEVEKSLDFYDKTLQRLPEHRSALLGKLKCLSLLMRHDEAIRTAETLITLGQYFIGDGFYWLAWNQNQLGDAVKAWENVTKSMNYLLSTEVFTLSGLIAFQLERLDEARKDLEEAVRLNGANCEALLYLGQVLGKEKEWESSGEVLGRAALCFEASGEALRREVSAIAGGELPETRKEALLKKKDRQLKNTERLAAAACYNAAVGFANAGHREPALAHARKASAHSDFTEAAAKLLAILEKPQ